MLKLVGGTLEGSVKYSDLYIESDEEEDTSSTSTYKDHGRKKKQRKIPSLPWIAWKVARLEKTQLDEKQYIAYEMIDRNCDVLPIVSGFEYCDWWVNVILKKITHQNTQGLNIL